METSVLYSKKLREMTSQKLWLKCLIRRGYNEEASRFLKHILYICPRLITGSPFKVDGYQVWCKYFISEFLFHNQEFVIQYLLVTYENIQLFNMIMLTSEIDVEEGRKFLKSVEYFQNVSHMLN